jgi:hypothetical protein
MITTNDTNDPTINNSIDNIKNGRYVLGGTTEVSSFAIEMWDANVLPSDPSDILYYVEKKYEGKPHLLGYIFYGDTGLWWIICLYNKIIDPLQEIVEGRALLIPTLDRLKTQIFSNNSKVGGTPTTRSVVN